MEGKKLYYKNGDPEVFRYFNKTTWDNMTSKERDMWTEHHDNDPALIPEEVVEFTQQNPLGPTMAELKKENEKLKKQLAKAASPEPDPIPIEISEADAEKKAIREELKRLGVKMPPPNTGLPKLRERLKNAQENADNTE